MQPNAIPYQIRAKLLQLEPCLEADWHLSIIDALQNADAQLCEDIDYQILKPKEIHWNRLANTFEYKENTSLAILRHRLTHPKMSEYARTLSESLEGLKKLSDSFKIADYLENSIKQINQIQVEEDFVLQREKTLIHRTFLLNAARIIKRIKIDEPEGLRHLTEDEIKEFIIEVYIKHQMLDYWYKPLLKKESKINKLPVFRYLVLREQKVRHFHIVKTSSLIYLVAPVMHVESNPYSIRRFLIEEQGDLPDQILLNVIVLDLYKSEEIEYIEHLKSLMKRMATIPSQIHLDVIDVVNQLEEIYEDKLIPLLIEPVQFVGKKVDVAVQRHLKKLETVLTDEFFALMHVAAKKHLSHIDEFDYLYLNARRLLSELLAYYREFKVHPSLAFNQDVKMFEYKLFAYLKLLEKRKQECFVPLNENDWGFMHERSIQPIRALQSIISQNLADYRELRMFVNKAKHEQTTESTSLTEYMMTSDQTERDLLDAQKSSIKLKRKIFMNILEIPRSYPNTSVFIEFEDMRNFSDGQRHYAFPSGDNGLTRLPVLFSVPDTYTEFDVEEFNTSIQYDLNFFASSMNETIYLDDHSPIFYST